ncbi:MAG: serine/threonine-protein phosphatase [Lachnospiraceae bacterium]|nr:serine/threonine-protein phosphatase [Lachnospiraceae bacterium]
MEENTVLLGNKKTDKHMPDSKPIKYILECLSDIGISRNSNQDACCARIICRNDQTIVMAAVCDGVGGLADGEYASRSTIQLLNNWFDFFLINMVMESSEDTIVDVVSQKLHETICEQNRILYEYGCNNGVKLGTTLTMVLFLGNQYLIAQVGDSRAYCIKNEIKQLTDDQSLVAREVREGRLRPEEAITDPRRNVILQCLGGQENILPVYQKGQIEESAIYLLCTDGFTHKLNEKELEEIMSAQELVDRTTIRRAMMEGIECVKRRGEKDNITVVAVKTM